MAKVGVIIVSYRADPERLFTSIAPSRHEVCWYIFVHGQDARLRSKLDALAAGTTSRYFPYGVNRGLARSWNEGLIASFGDGNDVTIVLNDDLFFYEGGFDQFVDFVLAEKQRVPDFGLITLQGKETGGPDGIGSGIFYLEARPQDAACMAVGQGAIDRVGYFDENFWPAYNEDIDYFYRLSLSGLKMICDERILLEHDRSFSIRHDRLTSLLHHERKALNEKYYVRKWGGTATKENFVHPFNDRTLGCLIPEGQRAAPFGPKYDRTDLGSASALGVLDNSFIEDLVKILGRHDTSGRNYLEWGTGKSTPVMAEYARARDADFFLSIDEDAARLRRTAAKVPKYRFLHFRPFGPDRRGEDERDTDIDIDIDIGTDIDANADVDYVSYPLGLGRRFDVVLIAGRWQMECALVAPAIVERHGLVILHDAERARHQAMRQFLRDTGASEGLDNIARVDDWQQARDRALRDLYDVVEETPYFTVLRAKPPSPPRRGRDP